MDEFLYTLKSIGSLSLSVYWFPLALWTVLGLAAVVAMKYSNRIHAIYQYHGRVALLIALPVGMFTSYAISKLSAAFATNEGLTTKFIVVQSPITVSAANPGQTISLSEPILWLGISIIVVFLIAAVCLIKIAVDFTALRRFSKSLEKNLLPALPLVSGANQDFAERCRSNISVSFSDTIQVPFTFGWFNTTIVFPEAMKADTEKFNLALRHELMHIRHRDYLLNNLLLVVKALFWFHPLVHYLYKDFKEYREISCDSEVLADSAISKKVYAQLLLELAPKSVFPNSRTVSMAVNPSTLKKRIQVMTSQSYSNKIFRSSIILALISTLSITGIIACSDMQNSGITNQDVAEVQRNIQTTQADEQPLYIINGEWMDIQEKGDVISRIKPKYIESINVLKGQKAIDQYGEAGKNGVIEIQLLDKEKAYSDLLPSSPPPVPQRSSEEADHFVVVEEMPELVGGLKSIQKNIRYPEQARKERIEGRVIVQFIVNEEGKVENPQIIRGIGGGCDKEALRVVSQAEFKPGKQRGKPVRVQYSLPIVFKLAGYDDMTSDKSTSQNKNDFKTDEKEVDGVKQLRDLVVVGYGQNSRESVSPNISVREPDVVHKKFILRNFSNNRSGVISGKLVDPDTEKPLPGANIVVSGTNIGTSTDLDGEFQLRNIPPGKHKISVSYIGYKMITFQINVK